MSKCCENSIKEAAYYLWQNAGCPTGQDEYFWALAVSQMGSSSKKSSCSCSTSSKKVVAKSASTSTKKTTAKSVSTSTKKAAVKSASTSTKKA